MGKLLFVGGSIVAVASGLAYAIWKEKVESPKPSSTVQASGEKPIMSLMFAYQSENGPFTYTRRVLTRIGASVPHWDSSPVYEPISAGAVKSLIETVAKQASTLHIHVIPYLGPDWSTWTDQIGKMIAEIGSNNIIWQKNTSPTIVNS